MTERIELWVCATRNWIDKDGVAHGPRWTTPSADRHWAEMSAKNNNEHHLAGRSEWFALKLVEEPTQ